MTIQEIRTKIIEWITTGIPSNVKSLNLRTLLTNMSIRMDLLEAGRLKVTKAEGNFALELEVGDNVYGYIESQLVYDAIYLGGDTSLLASYLILSGPGTGGSSSGYFEYTDINDMIVNQSEQSTGDRCYVADASDDPNITSGDAIYIYLGTTLQDLIDYRRLTDGEISLVTNNINRTFRVTDLSTSASTTVDSGLVKVQYENVDNSVIAILFPIDFSKYLLGMQSNDSEYDFAISIFNRTQNCWVGEASVGFVTVNTNYVKVTTSQKLIPYPNLAAGDIIEVYFNSYKTPDSSGTPATRKITFGLEAINNTAGQSTTVNEMIAAMNTVGFTINEGELALLEIQVLQVINGAQWRVFKRYLFKNNNVSGTWGTGSTNGPITYANLIEVAWRQFIKIEANSEYNDLGDIGSSTIEDHLNSLPANTYVLTNLATDYYFTCIRNGTEQVYQVKPLSLPLTISNDTVTSADFDLVASSENPEPTPIPTEEQIKGTRISESVATTKNIDLDTVSDFHYTMTADTAFTFTNTPTGTQVRRCKLRLTGEFAPSWTQAGLQVFGDAYDGTKWNDVLVEMWLDGTIKGLLIFQQRETA